ncbi:MAG: PorV/PorQ family protein [Calditrichia bacterium]|nr:PorV/PorQ family protein [Calditrichia bacterium]
MFKNILKKCVILLIISFSILYGEGVKKVGSVGYKFLSIPIGARSTAMGNSLLTYADGASAVFWNPALLTQVDKYSVFISHNNHFVDLKMDAVAAAMRVGNIGVFALRFFSFSSGEMPETVVDFQNNSPIFVSDNTFEYMAYGVGLSYATMLTDKFGVGLNASYAAENLTKGLPQENKTNSLMFDIGTIYTPSFPGFKSLRMALSISNFSSDTELSGQFDDWNNGKVYETRGFEKFPQSLTFRFGISFDAYRNDMHYIMLTTNIEHPNDNLERYNLGSEYGFKNLFFLRGGYIFNHDTRSFSGGFGIKYSVSDKYDIHLDYAYVDYGLLQDSQLISFSFGW